MTEMEERIARTIRSFQRGTDFAWEVELDTTRAVLAAMRRLTPDMIDAVTENGPNALLARAVWETCIDTAISPPEIAVS